MATTTLSADNFPDVAVYEAYYLNLSVDGVAFIFSDRFSQCLQVTAQGIAAEYQVTAEQVIEEFRRFIAIKSFAAKTLSSDVADIFGSDMIELEISPTPLMSDLWHAAILDTPFYTDLEAAVGILHQRPSGAAEQEAEQGESCEDHTSSVYTALFSDEPLEHSSLAELPTQPEDAETLRNKVSFLIMSLHTGWRFSITVDEEMLIGNVKTIIDDCTGLPETYLGLIYQNHKLDNERTLESYGIVNNSELDLAFPG